MTYPITFHWDGEAMTPIARFQKRCDELFVIGETYPLVVHEERSSNSHRHYFAAVHEAWKQLPEQIASKFLTSEHLRKYALIRSGFYDERTIALESEEDAKRVQLFIQPHDEYAIVTRDGSTVSVFTAKSQSMRSMGKKSFQESKEAVLGILSDMIGVDAATLQNEAGQAA